MSKILAIGSPKGGVAKTTTAVTLATIAARLLQLRVLLVDADPNQSAYDWASRCNDTVMPLDVATGHDVGELAQLRRSRAYDLHVIDLPGAREGAFKTVLRGGANTARPVADLLLVPVHPELMDQRPVVRVVHDEVIPLGLPHLIIATMVKTVSMARANNRNTELREDHGLSVSDAVIREYSIYDEAIETNRTVLDIGGRHSYAREAEADYRALAIDVFDRLALDTTALQEG